MIEELFKTLFKRNVKIINFEAKVLSVDKDKDTCVVKPEDGPEITGVKLRSILGDINTKIVVYPKVGSYVTLSILYNLETECYVSQVSEVDEIRTNCENVIFNGGDNGGLVNWPAVKAELDKTNEVVNALVTSVTGFVPVPNDGGNALKTYATAQLDGKETGDFNGKEDNNVKH